MKSVEKIALSMPCPTKINEVWLETEQFMVTNDKRIDYLRTEKRIEDALVTIAEKKAIDKISVNEIVQAAGLSRGAFYLHYNDKYETLEKISNRFIGELLEINKDFHKFIFAEHDLEKPYPYFVDTYEWVYENRRYMKVLLSDNGDLLFTQRWKEAISEYFLKTLKRNGAQFQYPEIISVVLSSSLMSIIIYWLNSNEQMTPDELSVVAGKIVHGILDMFK